MERPRAEEQFNALVVLASQKQQIDLICSHIERRFANLMLSFLFAF